MCPSDTARVGCSCFLPADASGDCRAIEGAFQATVGRQRTPDSRPTTVSPSERPAAALGPPPSRAQPALFRQARPTFSPASIKLPLCPLAGGSCARARSPPTIYTPAYVTRASQSPAPSLGPQPTQPIGSRRGQRPGWNEPENRLFPSFAPPSRGTGISKARLLLQV